MARAKYGHHHQQLRRRLLPLAYWKPCPRCNELMLPGQPLDLGHTDDGTGYNGIEHASCNRSAGARLAQQGDRRSRDW